MPDHRLTVPLATAVLSDLEKWSDIWPGLRLAVALRDQPADDQRFPPESLWLRYFSEREIYLRAIPWTYQFFGGDSALTFALYSIDPPTEVSATVIGSAIQNWYDLSERAARAFNLPYARLPGATVHVRRTLAWTSLLARMHVENDDFHAIQDDETGEWWGFASLPDGVFRLSADAVRNGIAKWEGNPPKDRAAALASLEDAAYLSAGDFAKVLSLERKEQKAMENRLARWRENRRPGDGWKEVADRGPREPQYFYQVKAVRPILKATVENQAG
ncbi:MAG: hypothetical protein KY475_15065 [Planctomycetes bacterium]|nr:hypothetical protein [Planctomycetota bacterium]